MLDAKALIKQAQTLISQGNLDQALLAARSAVDADDEDANAWWQLARVFAARKDDKPLLPVVQKLVSLSPDFAGGWCEYGAVLYRSNRFEEAAAMFEKALELSPDHVRSLQHLEFTLEELGREELSPRRIQLLEKLCEVDGASNQRLFALAYLYGEQGDASASASVYERLEDLSFDENALKNLSVMYRKLGRDADAIDALRLCLRNNPADELAVENMLELRTRERSTLREALRKLPDPYLPQEDWYKHYVDPFALLQMEPSEVTDNVKAVQRARQALLRELELEDNTVSWMPGLHIDRSSALALFEELNNADLFAAHERAHENPALQAFLSTGSLRHFTTDNPDIDDVQLQCTVDRDEVAPLSLKFAAQFDDVLTRAIERNDLAAVQALLSGRRWVLPEHAERCLEGALRALERLSEPLDAMYEAAQKGPVKLADIRAWLQTSRLAKLLPHLSIEFHTIHEQFYRNMRGLSIAHYGRASDPAEALELLNRAQICAEKSAAMLHQFEADRAMLQEEAAKEVEKNVSLTFGEKSFSMTKTAVKYGSQTIRTEDVHFFKWGMTQNGSGTNSWRLSISFGDSRGTEISLAWTPTAAGMEAQKALWLKMIEATLAYVIDHALANFKKKLNDHTGVRMGDVLVFEAGVRFSVQGFIFKKDHFAPWASLKTHMANGDVVIKDVTNPKVFARLPIATVDNALLLRTLAHHKES